MPQSGKLKRGRPAKVAKEESSSNHKPQEGGPGPGPDPDRIIASNAYMLLYRAKKPADGRAEAAPTVELPERCSTLLACLRHVAVSQETHNCTLLLLLSRYAAILAAAGRLYHVM